MKDVGTLLPFIRENSQDFQSWNCSGTVCNEWNKYTFRKDLQIQEQGRKTGTQVPAQAHVGGLVEKFHAQTWKTNTYLGAIPPGKGKPEEHFTIQFTQTFTHPCNSALAGFAQGMFPSESPALMCFKHTATDGRIHGWEFSFPQSPSGYSTNPGQEIFFSVPAAASHHRKFCALLHLLQFSHPVTYKTSYKWGRFSYSIVTLLSPLLFSCSPV